MRSCNFGEVEQIQIVPAPGGPLQLTESDIHMKVEPVLHANQISSPSHRCSSHAIIPNQKMLVRYPDNNKTMIISLFSKSWKYGARTYSRLACSTRISP
jgi:hypothetical protein